jgi:hypothetical protein
MAAMLAGAAQVAKKLVGGGRDEQVLTLRGKLA